MPIVHYYLFRQPLSFDHALLTLVDVLEQGIEQVPRVQIVAGVKYRDFLQADNDTVNLVFVWNLFSVDEVSPFVDRFFVPIDALINDVGARNVASGVNGIALCAQKLESLRAGLQDIFIVVHLHDVGQFVQEGLQAHFLPRRCVHIQVKILRNGEKIRQLFRIRSVAMQKNRQCLDEMLGHLLLFFLDLLELFGG